MILVTLIDILLLEYIVIEFILLQKKKQFIL